MATFDRSVSRTTGPLAVYAAGFTAELADEGYCEGSIYLHLQLVAELSGWLASQGLGVEQLSPAVADRFMATRGAARHRLKSRRGLAPVLQYLRGLDVLPAPDPRPVSEQDALISAYQQYLRGERGVCQRTVSAYTPLVAAFLAAAGDPLGEVLSSLTGPAVLDILRGQLRECNPATAKQIAKAVRSLLRFLYAEGHTSRELASIVPRVARSRLAGLPTRLDAATIAALLTTCDRTTKIGLRDYAVLLMLARLGLRACEAARLSLDDFNWRAGEVTIHGKGDSVEVLPLPWDVGEAVSNYLRIRPEPHSSATPAASDLRVHATAHW